MHWEVRRASDDRSAGADASEEHWATRLVLHLPTLGQVEAKLSLYNDSVVMRLVAPDAAQTLSQHTADLRSQFLRAGLTLEQLSIQEQEHESSPLSNEDHASFDSPSPSEPSK